MLVQTKRNVMLEQLAVYGKSCKMCRINPYRISVRLQINQQPYAENLMTVNDELLNLTFVILFGLFDFLFFAVILKAHLLETKVQQNSDHLMSHWVAFGNVISQC